jgi:DNA-binding transcriptional MocR family regulator
LTLEHRADPAAVDASWLLAQISGRSAAEIYTEIATLIRDDTLPTGTRLPTIRDVARGASVSVGLIADAWGQLRDSGLIDTRRRGGTRVSERSPAAPVAAARFPGWSHVDLLLCSPDVSLQPSLSAALLSSLAQENLNAWGRDFMTNTLREAVEPHWPFPAEAWTTAGGGSEALLLATAAAAPNGGVVAVDEPVSPGYLDTLKDLGVTPIGVESDRSGPLPESLRAALTHNPTAFIYQPGGPFAVNHRPTQARVDELAAVLLAHERALWVIEDDSVGPLASGDAPSMGHLLPDRVLRIRTYCKAYGTDLRTSVLGGSRTLIERSIYQRSHGIASNSRILQNALAYLITDAGTAAVVSEARSRYTSRKTALLESLAAAGVPAHSGPESLVVWIEVADETATLLALASQGISVGSGSKSFVTKPTPDLLRVSITQLPDAAEPIRQFAELIARASKGTLREYFD